MVIGNTDAFALCCRAKRNPEKKSVAARASVDVSLDSSANDTSINGAGAPTRREILRGMAAATGACWSPPARRRAPRRGNAGANRQWLPGGLQVRGSRFYKTTNRLCERVQYWSALPIRATATPPAGIRCGAISISLQGMGINMLRMQRRVRRPDTEPSASFRRLQPDAGKYDPRA